MKNIAAVVSADDRLFSRFYEDTVRIRAISGTSAKIAALACSIQRVDVRCVWEALLHPLRMYYLTPAVQAKHAKKTPPVLVGSSYLKILEGLSLRGVTPMIASSWIAGIFSKCSWQAIEGMRMVLDRDARCGVSVALFNKAAESLGLAPLPDYSKSIASGKLYSGEYLGGRLWYWSRKYDGVRCRLVWNDNKIIFISRNGRAMSGLDRLERDFANYFPRNAPLVLDGELSLRTKDGGDDFKGIQSALNRKNHVVENVQMHVIDLLSFDEYAQGASTTLFEDRQCSLRKVHRAYRKAGGKRIHVAEQVLIGTQEEADTAIEYAFSMGWEGSIFRKNAPYKGRKTADILKVKKEHDCEVKVLEIIPTTKRMKVAGKDVDVRCMGAAVVDYWRDGVRGSLRVGSGWSDAQRIKYFKTPKKLLGAVITITYMEETEDKYGRPSLRLPRVKIVHGKERSF